MILLVIVFGMYLIGVAGYYKLSTKTADEVEDTAYIRKSRPWASMMILGSVALAWPVLVYWSLVVEAGK